MDKNPYRHDSRADKDLYLHDRHADSTAFERLVIILLGGLNQFYGIPTLALGPDVAQSYLWPTSKLLSGILDHDNINKIVE